MNSSQRGISQRRKLFWTTRKCPMQSEVPFCWNFDSDSEFWYSNGQSFFEKRNPDIELRGRPQNINHFELTILPILHVASIWNDPNRRMELTKLFSNVAIKYGIRILGFLWTTNWSLMQIWKYLAGWHSPDIESWYKIHPPSSLSSLSEHPTTNSIHFHSCEHYNIRMSDFWLQAGNSLFSLITIYRTLRGVWNVKGQIKQQVCWNVHYLLLTEGYNLTVEVEENNLLSNNFSLWYVNQLK